MDAAIADTSILSGLRAMPGGRAGSFGVVKHSRVLFLAGTELLARHPEPRNYTRSGAKEIRAWPIVGGRQFRMRCELGTRRFERDAAATPIQSLVPVVDVTSSIDATKMLTGDGGIPSGWSSLCRLGDATMIRRRFLPSSSKA